MVSGGGALDSFGLQLGYLKKKWKTERAVWAPGSAEVGLDCVFGECM